jgi:predicted RNA-binding Zn-ribbon protein involved in translation (DUF1610 family)
MVLYPLCISCGVSLQEKSDYDSLSNKTYQIYYCPSCQEIYQKTNKES